MNLYELSNEVDSKEKFLGFLETLKEDKVEEERRLEAGEESDQYGPGPCGWENGTIEAFLDAAHAWARSHNSVEETPSWKVFAKILHAGKFYE